MNNPTPKDWQTETSWGLAFVMVCLGMVATSLLIAAVEGSYTMASLLGVGVSVLALEALVARYVLFAGHYRIWRFAIPTVVELVGVEIETGYERCDVSVHARWKGSKGQALESWDTILTQDEEEGALMWAERIAVGRPIVGFIVGDDADSFVLTRVDTTVIERKVAFFVAAALVSFVVLFLTSS